MRQWIRSVTLGLLALAALVPASHAQTRGGYDGKGHLTMHGTPRFVLGVYDSGGGYSTDPAFWENQIFSPTGSRGLAGIPLNVYLNYHLGQMPIGQTNALLDVLNNHGMMYLQTGNCFDAGSWTRYGPTAFSISSQSYVQQFAQHPAALGYYIMDECVDALVPETTQHNQQLHGWDPQGVTFAATLAAGYINPALWTGAADVIGTDPYPLYGPEPAAGYTHFIVADFVSKLRAVARPDRPVWSVVQFFKFTSNSRMPTPDEMRAHAVMSIVEGAQGIFWWDIGVNGLRALDAGTVSTYMSHLRTLTTELAGLEPALVADDANGALVGNSTRFADPIAGRISQLQRNIAVEWLFSRKEWYQAELAALQAGNTSKSGGLLNGAANVRTLTKIVNGVGYVFAYNYTNVSQPVTFTWQNAPSSVRESKTGQTYAMNGASWSDTFGPYQARIYVIGGAGSGGGTTQPPPSGASLSVAFTNPAAGATVSGTTTVTMAASGGSGLTYTVKVDGTTAYSGTNPSFSWNTTSVGNGAHSLTATVTDSAGRTAGASLSVTVSNGAGGGGGGGGGGGSTAGFTASFSYPGAGAAVSGSQSVGMSTTAAWGQSKTFTLSVDGTVLTSQTLTGTTLWYTWNTTGVPDGARTLTVAVTMNGQTATTTLPVTVANGGATSNGNGGGGGSPAPASYGASFSYPTSGAAVSGAQTIGMQTTAAWGQTKTFTLSVDGTVITSQTTTGTTLWYTWDTTTATNGNRTLTLAVAMNGETAIATLPVKVANGGTPTVALDLNGSTFSQGQPLRVNQTVGNPGGTVVADVYFGIVLPPETSASFGCAAGTAAVAFASEAFSTFTVRCSTDPPSSFPALAGSVTIPAGLPLTTDPDFFGFDWPDAPAGVYTIFMALTKPGALSGADVNPADLIVVATASLTYTP